MKMCLQEVGNRERGERTGGYFAHESPDLSKRHYYLLLVL
jgi:hypothetical protein